MKNLFLISTVALLSSGCAMSRNIATVKHADGSGTTRYRYVAAGGVFRPGVIVIVSETVGSNAPNVLVQASGPPFAPSIGGVSGAIAEAVIIGNAIKGQKGNSTSTTTIINEDVPKPPKKNPPIKNPPSKVPPGHQSKDSGNRGR